MSQNALTFAEISFIIINVNKNNKRKLVKLKSEVNNMKEYALNDCEVMVYETTIKDIMGWAECLFDEELFDIRACSDIAIQIAYKDGTQYINVGGDISGEYKGKKNIESIIYSDSACYMVYGAYMLQDYNNLDDVIAPKEIKHRNIQDSDYDFRPVAICDLK